jgi:hypothetical protein
MWKGQAPTHARVKLACMCSGGFECVEVVRSSTVERKGLAGHEEDGGLVEILISWDRFKDIQTFGIGITVQYHLSVELI